MQQMLADCSHIILLVEEETSRPTREQFAIVVKVLALQEQTSSNVMLV